MREKLLVHEALMNVYDQLRDYPRAFRHQARVLTLKDSIFNKENDQNDFWVLKSIPEPGLILSESTARMGEEAELEEESSFLKAYPNPFTEKANLTFTVKERQPVSLRVYDLQGKEIANLYAGEAQADQEYTFELDGAALNRDMYIAHLQTRNQVRTVKLMRIR